MTVREGEIGRYRIVRMVGSGGMAHTYLCTLDGIGGFQKYVVIKMLNPDRLNDARYINMFLDEARLWAKLNHPNIPQAFELGTFKDIPYIVMEYVPGPTLSLLSRRQDQSSLHDLYRIARIGAEIARALDYAYYGAGSDGAQLKVVHRDVALNNILLSTSGRPKLIDFGIAMSEGRLAQTEVGMFKGRIQYMAPEQLADQEIDHRTDLFQLGISLYRLLTGRAAYSSQSKSPAAMWKARMEGQVVPILTLNPKCPPMLAALVDQCIQPDRNDRPERGTALAEALDEVIGRGSPAPIDATDLAAWVQALFPNQEWTSTTGMTDPAASLGSGFTTGSGYSPIESGHGSVPPAPPPVDMRRRMAFAAALVGVLSVGGVALFGMSVLLIAGQLWRGDSTAVETQVEPNRAATVYLDEIERLVAIGRYQDAGMLLLKAREAGPTDPEVVVRLTRVGSAVEGKLMLASAEQAFEAKDFDLAAGRVGEMLDLEPTNPEALALLDKISEARDKAAQSKEPDPAQAVPKGRLTVASQPPARVFVDDRPHGMAPLRDLQLAPGQHTVSVRLAGYVPLKRTITVRSNELFQLDITLEPLAESAPPPNNDRISSLVAAAAPPEAPPTPDPVILPSPAGTEPVPVGAEGVVDPAAPVTDAATDPGGATTDTPWDDGAADVGTPTEAPAPAPAVPDPQPPGTSDELKSIVPMPKQALVLLRALSFDARLPGRVGNKLVIASVYSDSVTKKRALRMNVEFSNTGMQIQGRTPSTTAVEFTTAEALAQEIAAQGIDVIYVPSGMGAVVGQIARVARDTRVVTIGAEPSYLSAGLSLGVFDKAGSDVLGLNQEAATAQGAQFSGEILKVAVLVR
jgi:serine/threonine protein kinase